MDDTPDTRGQEPAAKSAVRQTLLHWAIFLIVMTALIGGAAAFQ